MRRALTLFLLLAIAQGCAGNQAAHGELPNSAAATSEVGELTRKQDQQSKHIAELEARIGLLESETRKQREIAGLSDRPPAQTVRIAHATPEIRDTSDASSAAPLLASEDTTYTGGGTSVSSAAERPREVDARRHGKREREVIPTLRLYGSAPEARSDGELSNDLGSLPVAPLPEDRAKAELGQGSSDDNLAMPAYRSALQLLRERHYDEAASAFSALLEASADPALVDRALYWLGEARYAQRDYQSARDQFQMLLKRFPRSDKAPDSLLKIGLCSRRLGDEAGAQGYFRRVLEKYPHSEAATIASREGAT